MSLISIYRRAAVFAVTALALASAGSAVARPFDINSAGSYIAVPRGEPVHYVSLQHAGSGGAAWLLVAIGCVVLLAIGAVVITARRHRADSDASSTLAT